MITMKEAKKGLILQLFVKGMISLIGMMGLLFVSAGTISYLGAWVLFASIFICSISFGIWLYYKYPVQFENRFHEEKGEQQQRILVLIGIILISSLILAGLDWRFSWSKDTPYRFVIAAILLISANLIYRNVFMINPFLSNTVEVHPNQTIISTGMYRVVRHPMYLGTCLTYLSGIIILGSWLNTISFVLFVIVISMRIANEEKQLIESIPKYNDYCKLVKYRLLPFIW